jgi:hypothetical protein
MLIRKTTKIPGNVTNYRHVPLREYLKNKVYGAESFLRVR